MASREGRSRLSSLQRVKINPNLGESIRAELDALKAQRLEEQEAAAKAAGPSPEEKMQLANKDKMLKKKIMMQKQTMQMQRQGRLPLNYSEEAGPVRYCPKCDKDETRDECRYGGEYWDENSKPAKAEDEREMPTKATLFKNKLRARGIQVAGLTLAPRNMKTYDDLGEGMTIDMEGDQIDERTRYAKETGKDPQTGKPSEKGGTLGGDDTHSKVMRQMKTSLRKTGGLMSSRGKPIQPQGKKKDPGAKGYQGVTPVDRIKGQLARKRAPKPDMGSRFD